MTDHICSEHADFHLNLQYFGDTNIKYLEVRGSCRECGKAMRFRGPIGLNPLHPTVALDGSEAVFPFVFDGEVYDGKAVGYSVTSPARM